MLDACKVHVRCMVDACYAAADVCTSQSFWLARLCACSTAFWPCVARLLVCSDVRYYVGP